jgi:hypothetical protein
MAGLRIVIEWFFGCVNRMFPFLNHSSNLCFGNGNVGVLIAASKIINNATSCLEPNMISQKFKCPPPGIQQYLQENLPSHQSDCKDRDGNCIARESDYTLYEVASDHVARCVAKGARRT